MSKPTAKQVTDYSKKFVRKAPYGSPNTFTRWFYGDNRVAPFCAIFVYYCLAHTGGKYLMEGCSNKAYVPTIYNWAKAKGYFITSGSKAKLGDLCIFDWNKDNVADHIGFIIKDNGNEVETLEGNTDNGRVAYRTRSKGLIKGYVRLPYATAAAPKKKKSIDQIAKEVLAGKWGNGITRKNKLKAAGYDYEAVQKKVNQLTKKKHTTGTVLVSGLYVRKGAGKKYQSIGTLKKGSKVTIYEKKKSGIYTWVRIGTRKWACAKRDKKIYIK